MEILDNCSAHPRAYTKKGYPVVGESHGVKNLVEVTMISLEDGLHGLSLWDFKTKPAEETMSDSE